MLRLGTELRHRPHQRRRRLRQTSSRGDMVAPPRPRRRPTPTEEDCKGRIGKIVKCQGVSCAVLTLSHGALVLAGITCCGQGAMVVQRIVRSEVLRRNSSHASGYGSSAQTPPQRARMAWKTRPVCSGEVLRGGWSTSRGPPPNVAGTAPVRAISISRERVCAPVGYSYTAKAGCRSSGIITGRNSTGHPRS